MLWHISPTGYPTPNGGGNHYLSGIQNNPGHLNNQGAGETSWDECVHALDVEKLARGLHDCGAHYYFITVMQGTETMIAPNAAFDRIAGTKHVETVVLLSKLHVDHYVNITIDSQYRNNKGKAINLFSAIPGSFVHSWIVFEK